jgi:leucyl-tRNA synthetase
MLSLKESMRNDERANWSYQDTVFHNEINKAICLTDQHYENTSFREAIKTGFYELQAARDRYREFASAENGMNWQLVIRYIEVQCLLLAPVCPHLMEHIWSIIGKTDSIMNAMWPESEKVDEVVLKESQYFTDVSHDFRVRMKKIMELREKKGFELVKPEYGVIYIVNEYPQWQAFVLTILKKLYNNHTNELPENYVILEMFKNEKELLPFMKKVMPFVQTIKADLKTKGVDCFDLKLPFDARSVLERNLNYLMRNLELKELWIEDASSATDPKVIEECTPNKPISVFTTDPYKAVIAIDTVGALPNSVIKLPIFDGDTYVKVRERINRIACTGDYNAITLWRYLVSEDETKVDSIPLSASFLVKDGRLSFVVPDCVPVPIEFQLKYTIKQ